MYKIQLESFFIVQSTWTQTEPNLIDEYDFLLLSE